MIVNQTLSSSITKTIYSVSSVGWMKIRKSEDIMNEKVDYNDIFMETRKRAHKGSQHQTYNNKKTESNCHHILKIT